MLTSIVILLILIFINGLFAMAELAVVSARKPLLAIRAEGGSKGATAALALAANPGPFFSTTQTGITLIAIISGAYGGATLEEPVKEWLLGIPLFADYADRIGLVVVVGAISYLSLVIGELVPKQLALKRAEAIACWVSRPMQILAVVTHPVIWLLDNSNRVLLRVMGVHAHTASVVTQEEVKAMIAEGTQSGALDSQEQSMLEGVLRLDELSVQRAMTTRQDVVWVDTQATLEEIGAKIRDSHHSRYVLCDGGFEHIVGIVTAKDLLAMVAEGGKLRLVESAIEPIMLPDSASMMSALEHFRKSTANIALVVDEYGGFEGILTFKDILEAIVGYLPEGAHYTAPSAVMRDDGSWLIDGLMPLHEVEATLGVKKMDDANAGFHTLAGFLMHHLQHIPVEGEHFDWQGMRFEVVDMDDNRLDKVLVVLPRDGEDKEDAA